MNQSWLELAKGWTDKLVIWERIKVAREKYKRRKSIFRIGRIGSFRKSYSKLQTVILQYESIIKEYGYWSWYNGWRWRRRRIWKTSFIQKNPNLFPKLNRKYNQCQNHYVKIELRRDAEKYNFIEFFEYFKWCKSRTKTVELYL